MKRHIVFTDELLGEGVTYETAGSLQGGRRTWLLAKLPQRYIISRDEITPYLVIMNSHDGSGAIKAAMTPSSYCLSKHAESCVRDSKTHMVYHSYRGYWGKVGRCQKYTSLCGFVYGRVGKDH